MSEATSGFVVPIPAYRFAHAGYSLRAGKQHALPTRRDRRPCTSPLTP